MDTIQTCAMSGAGKNPAHTVLLDDNTCKNCKTVVDVSEEGIQCRDCECWFHAIGCEKDAVSATTLFTTLKNATEKLSGFKTRFGKFFFICPHCDTEHEKKKSLKTDDKVTMLESKLTSMESHIDTQMKEMKQLIVDSFEKSARSYQIPRNPRRVLPMPLGMTISGLNE